MSIRARLNCEQGDFCLNADFDIPFKGVTAVFGPSGCGKSTLLRCIAGLDSPIAGSELCVDGSYWFSETANVPVHERRVGYVSQSPSLFPHLSVAGNLKYALRRRKIQPAAVSFEEVVDLLGISSLLQRRPDTLSGGEKQRVAIARALLSAPVLMLMDEPLAALDAQSKEDILPYLEKLCRTALIPVIYVSHSSDEVARLADHLLLIESGQISDQGPLSEVLSRTDSPLSRSADAFSVLNCRVQSLNGPTHLSVLAVGESDVEIFVPRIEKSDKQQARVRVSARDVSVCIERPIGSSILNILPVTVLEIAAVDGRGQSLLRLQVEGSDEVLLARVSAYSCEKLGLQPSMKLFAQVKSVALL
jgi:molybdate transport system ATP-binding protein